MRSRLRPCKAWLAYLPMPERVSRETMATRLYISVGIRRLSGLSSARLPLPDGGQRLLEFVVWLTATSSRPGSIDLSLPDRWIGRGNAATPTTRTISMAPNTALVFPSAKAVKAVDLQRAGADGSAIIISGSLCEGAGVESTDLRRFHREMSFHPIDGGAVVYDRNAKRLIALNAAAALIWIAVRDGSAPQAIRSKLAASFNLAEHEAERWIELTLASFEEIISNAAGAEDEALPTTAFKLMTGTDYKILDKSLRISAPDTALQLIDSMIGHLRCPRSVARSDGADMSMSIEPVEQSFAVSSSGDPTATTKQAEELVAEVERRIVQDLVPRVPHFLAFHAALLDLRGRAVLFPAPSGSGKTTLSAALTRQGWYCLTDEMALLDRSLQWQGLPFLPCIKAENYPLISSFYPALGDVVEHERSGRRVKFLPLPICTGRGRGLDRHFSRTRT